MDIIEVSFIYFFNIYKMVVGILSNFTRKCFLNAQSILVNEILQT